MISAIHNNDITETTAATNATHSNLLLTKHHRRCMSQQTQPHHITGISNHKRSTSWANESIEAIISMVSEESESDMVNTSRIVKGILKTIKSDINGESTIIMTNTDGQKQFRFNETVFVGEAHSSEEYDRKSDFTLILTPAVAYNIKRELNEFKANEMQVHNESKQNTQFYRV